MIPQFRAWHKLNNKMYPVLEIDFEHEEITVARGDRSEGCACCWEDDKWFKLKQVILMQSTGLKDKNGVEIFEFDIVDHNGETFVVIYENGSFIIKGISYRSSHIDGEPYLIGDDLLINRVDVLEIIDNDPTLDSLNFNPELLEAKDD